MSTVTKENEILSSIPEIPSSRSAAGTTASSTDGRQQPVAMEVAVTVNGARSIAGTDKREPFSESTKTVLIFGHGAVVRLSSAVTPGQLLFLTNEKTKKEVVCQVVKSKNSPSASGYIELEFTEPVAGFWGMRLPASGTAQSSNNSSSSTVPSKTSSTTETKSAPGLPRVALPTSPAVSSPSIEKTPLSASQPQAATNKPVQPAAFPDLWGGESSGNEKNSNVIEISKPKVASDSLASISKPSTAPKSLLDSDEIKMPAWLEPLARNAALASAAQAENPTKPHFDHGDGIFEVEDLSAAESASAVEASTSSDGASSSAPSFSLPSYAEEEESFPGRDVFRAVHDSISPEPHGGLNKKLVIGAIAAGVLLLGGGGYWYKQRSAPAEQANAAPAVYKTLDSPATSQSTTQPTTAAQSSPDSSSSYTAVSQPVNSTPSSNTVEVTNSNAGKRLATVDTVVVAQPQPKKPKLGDVTLSGPTVNLPSGAAESQSEEALHFENGAVQSEGIHTGLSVANSKQPVAPPAPLPVGGDVKSARLIAAIPPIYPSIAKAQRISGDVKIDALIDATGQVTTMTIVSGPALLQQAAKDALRRWKYEPATLDGKPVPMHLAVTVQFKL